MSDRSPQTVPLVHGRFQRVDPAIFRATFVADCMLHPCKQLVENPGPRNDACCQFGADTDLYERDAILAHAPKIAPLLPAGLRDPTRWFDDSQDEAYPEFPSGTATRTAVAPPGVGRGNGGCTFLHHEDGARGCVLHRAAMVHDIELKGFKPMICRLYPVTFMADTLCMSDDFHWYDCGGHRGGQTVYRVMRDTLRDVFDRELVTALDAVESMLEGDVAGRALPVIP